MEAKKLWDKGYEINKEVEDFTVDNDNVIDMPLVKYDCLASIAHAKMLGKIGILKPDEVAKLENALKEIISLWQNGKFIITKDQEDVNTAIENALKLKLGDLGKKIHTGRSRNDQILVAIRLYQKDNLKICINLAEHFIADAKAFSSKYGSIELPGYTHMRKAMPSSIKLWTYAFIDSMEDNLLLLKSALMLVDQSPLGTAAGYGSPLKLDREFTAKELGFARVQENPIYTQMSRGKFEATILHALTQIMLDLNKMACDLILFSMPEFGYFELPDSFTTGSSIMPQKKNPDLLELMRAKYHLVAACEAQVKGAVSSLPSGFNRDVQLTKEPIMRGFEVTFSTLKMASLLMKNLKVSKENCKKGLTPEVYATHEVYEMVKKGVPFRDAYQQVGKKYAGKSPNKTVEK